MVRATSGGSRIVVDWTFSKWAARHGGDISTYAVWRSPLRSAPWLADIVASFEA